MSQKLERPHSPNLPVVLLVLAVVFTLGLDLYGYLHIELINQALLTAIESAIDVAIMIAIYVLLKKSIWQHWNQTKEIAAISDSKSEILGIVSHDLRSPLGVIVGFAEALEDRELPPDAKRMASRIRVNAEHTLALINDLLSQNAIDEGGLRIKRTPTEVNRLVREVVESHQGAAAQKKLSLQLDADAVMAPVDPQKFRQIVDNLLSNAVKYSPHGKPIQLQLRRFPHAFRLTVKDEGPGLGDFEKTEVFKRFSRVKKQPTGGEFSTGLGLSITKRLVNLQSGKIWVDSDGPGTGSAFSVELPLH